jgi:hypothetical protein
MCLLGEDGLGGTSFTDSEATQMRHSRPGSFRAQARLLRRQFLQDGDLPFTDVLTEDVIARALAAAGDWLDRIFSPLVTLWVFLGQVLSADHSCRAAVARLIAHRVARGLKPCSPRTGAYCQARTRLPEAFFADRRHSSSCANTRVAGKCRRGQGLVEVRSSRPCPKIECSSPSRVSCGANAAARRMRVRFTVVGNSELSLSCAGREGCQAAAR